MAELQDAIARNLVHLVEDRLGVADLAKVPVAELAKVRDLLAHALTAALAREQEEVRAAVADLAKAVGLDPSAGAGAIGEQLVRRIRALEDARPAVRIIEIADGPRTNGKGPAHG